MHLGRQYRYTQFIGWTRWEAGYLVFWSLSATLFLQVSQWNFLTVPAPILTIIGSALAIIIAFKNQQCYARFDDALRLSGQLITNSLILANKLTSLVGNHDAAPSDPRVREIFYRHFAWLTALRFSLRERKFWENALESGNVRFLADLPTPESKSTLKEELNAYLSDAELHKFTTHRGDKEALILHWQYRALTDLYNNKAFSELMFTILAAALDDLARLQRRVEADKELSVCAELLFHRGNAGEDVRRDRAVRPLSVCSRFGKTSRHWTLDGLVVCPVQRGSRVGFRFAGKGRRELIKSV
jgi:putative membrane protein